MKTLNKIILSIITIFIIGCSDDFISQINDKSILEEDIQCLSLVVFPPKKEISNALEKLYEFDDECELSLIVSYKTGIVCNSNQNSDKKVLGMPDGYLSDSL